MNPVFSYFKKNPLKKTFYGLLIVSAATLLTDAAIKTVKYATKGKQAVEWCDKYSGDFDENIQIMKKEKEKHGNSKSLVWQRYSNAHTNAGYDKSMLKLFKNDWNTARINFKLKDDDCFLIYCG